MSNLESMSNERLLDKLLFASAKLAKDVYNSDLISAYKDTRAELLKRLNASGGPLPNCGGSHGSAPHHPECYKRKDEQK